MNVFGVVAHVSYPHEDGRLYDCAACESRCYCGDLTRTTPCVFCESLAEGFGNVVQDVTVVNLAEVTAGAHTAVIDAHTDDLWLHLSACSACAPDTVCHYGVMLVTLIEMHRRAVVATLRASAGVAA